MLTREQKTKIVSLLTTGLRQFEIAKLVGVDVSSVRNVIKTRKRLLFLSDSHCGHRAGLTPPRWWTNDNESEFYESQREIWGWYENTVTLLKADIMIFAGDGIDGKGSRSGGTEQITNSVKTQLEMLKLVLEVTGIKEIEMVYGTPYHTGIEEDYEAFLNIPGCDLKISGHGYVDIHGIKFDIKHKVGSSSTPYGDLTPMKKTSLWSQLWADYLKCGKPDVIVRGHTHKFNVCEDDTYKAIVCPALQGWGSKYGVRQCEKIVNLGLLWTDIYDGSTLGNIHINQEIPNLKCHRISYREL